LILECTVD